MGAPRGKVSELTVTLKYTANGEAKEIKLSHEFDTTPSVLLQNVSIDVNGSLIARIPFVVEDDEDWLYMENADKYAGW